MQGRFRANSGVSHLLAPAVPFGGYDVLLTL